VTNLINFAHRGASAYCPENTMASFARALELGASGIETDVQMTKDGRLVLIHDESLERTTGKKAWVKDLTWEEIQTLDAGSWFHADFAGEKLPSLEQLLELASDKGIIVNIELKNGFIQYPELERKVIETIRRYGMAERTIISGFNHYSLRECHQIAPDIRTGILYMEGLYEPWDYAKRIGADALHAYMHALTPELVAEAARNGVAYHPFTVNEESMMKALIEAGVAGIITDYPDKLAQILTK